MKVVILAAGLGTRLWPLSSPDKPKQFQPLIANQSLLQYTYSVINKIIPTEDLYVQTLAGLDNHVIDQLPDINRNNIIIVPKHRDTLAETLWALRAINTSDDEPILFKSVDQYIDDSDDFLTNLKSALTRYIGTTPAITLLGANYQTYSPNSGYLTATGSSVTSFVEKPSETYVIELLKDNTLYRSLFMFIISRNLLLEALDKVSAPWVEAGKQLLAAANLAEAQTLFSKMPTVDISSTLFQSAQDLKIDCVGESNNFFDVGRYSALYELNQKDSQGNVIIGDARLSESCLNNLIINTSDQPIKVADVSGMVIVQSPNGSFAADLKGADTVKNI